MELVFVPGERYRLVEIDATPLTRGSVFDVEGLSTPSRGSGDPRCLVTRGVAPTSYGGGTTSPDPAAARRPAVGLPFVRGCDGLELALGLSNEELRDCDVVLPEATEPHLVELDEAP